MLLATRQKHQLRSLHVNLSLKDSHIEQVHEHLHLGVVTDDEFSWRPHVTGTCKTVLKNICICCYSSNSLWILPSASCFTMISLHLPNLLWGTAVEIFYFNKLNSLHRRPAKLMITDS